MSYEEEFSKWLRRKENSFEENLKFAIRSWQSAEFTLPVKYEMVLQWLTEQKDLRDEQIDENDFKELLNLRAQPGLITQQVKKGFVDWLLEHAHAKSENTRKWCDLLHLLVEFELLQDLYRTNYDVQCRVYGEIFGSYEKYLLALKHSEQQFLSTFESEFFASVLKGLKEFTKRCADIVLFDKAYTAFVLQPMVQVLLFLRTFEIDFFEELLEIENLMCVGKMDQEIITRISKMALPVKLLCIECAIVKRKSDGSFLRELFIQVFYNFMNDSEDVNPSLSLTVAAFVIEMLGRHDVNLNVQINENESVVKYLGSQIFTVINKRKDSHLKEVLMLLCAALRLNPLILEQNVFEITAWVILAPKLGNQDELDLFEEYLVLLMDMFRRLSRAEKFVSNLLKTLKEHLQNVDLNTNKKRKSCADLGAKTPEKKKKLMKNIANVEAPKDFSKYLDILFNDFFKLKLTKVQGNNIKLTATRSFAKLQNYWPSYPVGLAFSKLITGLVSKPSLTIWKTLLYALKELIEILTNTNEIGENLLFQLDFNAALLSQYFAGCKLAEQSDKFLLELQKQREFTVDILKLFGQFLLKKDHQPRIMSAFLELAYFASSFELILSYYCPDGCVNESLQPPVVVANLHSFLSNDEWVLLEQRVLNFGKTSCKQLLYRLNVQKDQASCLLLKPKDEFDLKLTDPDIFTSILKTPQAKWYFHHLPRNEKMDAVNHFATKPELLHLALDDLELLEFVSLLAYENITNSFNPKYSLLKSLSCDFEKIRQCVEVTACELLIKELIDAVICQSEKEYKVKAFNSQEMKKSLELLTALPLGRLRRQRKTIIFVLHLCLFRDLKAAQQYDLAANALEILKDLLHFGQQILIFKYLPTSLLLKLLPADSCWELYEFIFSTIKNEEKGTEQFLQDLSNILNETQLSTNLNEEQSKLLMSAIETLTSLSGQSAKHMRKHLNVLLKIFSEYLSKHFTNVSDGKSKKDKKFVQKTLSAFAPYTSYILTKFAKAKEPTYKTEDSSDAKDFVDDDFRRISKIYIGHSMNYRNPHAVRLMQVALNHRELLHLDQDEIEFVLTNYWTQINEDLNDDKEQQKVSGKTLESAVKIIIGNKTNEDLLLILKTIANNLENTSFSNILQLLTLIAKCPFSTIKGAIFNEQYKQITVNITLRLTRDEQQHFSNIDLILKLLNCHQAVLDNKMIPISTDTMDSILSFLMDINIKKFRLNDTNFKDFHRLHLAVTEVCSSLIKYRHILLMDRVPQYMHVFKDLSQAIVWYKSERQKDTTLPSSEIDDLSELALKLEALMHLIARHKVGIKRVAPFVLTFIINLMVANKRPTTLYNKIKTHFENICYELVGICDHRVGRFILRCSNEAGRQLYELIVKDYQKYHKFKGKV